jgi:nitroreductase
LVVVASSEEPGGPDTKQADSAAIIENMLLAATDLGIQSVFMYSVLFKFLQEPELLAELGLPEGYTPVAAAAFGYSKTGIPEPRPLELRIETRWIK